MKDLRLIFKCKCGCNQVQKWISSNQGYVAWCKECSAESKMEWKMVVLTEKYIEPPRYKPKVEKREAKSWEML